MVGLAGAAAAGKVSAMSPYDQGSLDLDKLIARLSHRQRPYTDAEDTPAEIRRWLELADTLLNSGDTDSLPAAA